MGTPEIAVASLQAMHESGYSPVCVVTTPDKPSGRGLKINHSPVKQYAIENGMIVLQPEDLAEPDFLELIKQYKPDLIVVVAFRKLPAKLLVIPRVGCFNLHASLLPQYRGAAPINWAIINGETETGLTTFLLDNQIDTGKILCQEKVKITDDQNAGQLHDVLMEAGAKLVIKTIVYIESDNYKAIDQCTVNVPIDSLKKAPKIFKDDCRIFWNKPVLEVQNFIRGLCPYPSAFTELISPLKKTYYLKVLSSYFEVSENNPITGVIETDETSYLRISCLNGYVYLRHVQLAGKKIMNIDEFLRGFALNNDWSVRNVGDMPSKTA